MPKAYSYVRFSTSEQAKGDSKRRQSQLAVEYAKANGLELDDKLTYRDFGVSAYRGANVAIGKLGEFMEAIRKKEVKQGSFLLVESLDRLSRDHILPAQSIFTQIILEGVTIVTLTDNRVYSTDLVNKSPFLLIEAIIILIRANEESEQKSKRLKAMWQYKRDNINTKIMTSNGPAWLKYNKTRKRFDIIPERTAIIARMFNEYLEGMGYDKITKGLIKDNIPTWNVGKKDLHPWHRSYVRQIIRSRSVIGTLTLNRVDHSDGKKRKVLFTVEGYYPPVISDEIYSKSFEYRAKKTQKIIKPSTTWYSIFTGIGKCPKCGSLLISAEREGNNKFKTYLVCENAVTSTDCSFEPILSPRLESRVTNALKQALVIFPFPHRNPADILFDHQDQFQIQQTEHHICEFLIAARNRRRYDIKEINNSIRSLCEYVFISVGNVEVKFKLGPVLLIKYDRSQTIFAYDNKATIALDTEPELVWRRAYNHQVDNTFRTQNCCGTGREPC